MALTIDVPIFGFWVPKSADVYDYIMYIPPLYYHYLYLQRKS